MRNVNNTQLEAHPDVLGRERMKIARDYPAMPPSRVEEVARLRLALRITKTEIHGVARNPSVDAWIEDKETRLDALLGAHGG